MFHAGTPKMQLNTWREENSRSSKIYIATEQTYGTACRKTRRGQYKSESCFDSNPNLNINMLGYVQYSSRKFCYHLLSFVCTDAYHFNQ